MTLLIIGICLVCTVGAISVCDDKKEVWGNIKTWRGREYFLLFMFILYLAVLNLTAISVWMQLYPMKLWNIYMFLGMPTYASGMMGFKYYNQIHVAWDALKQILITNPLGFAVLSYTFYRLWNIKKFKYRYYFYALGIEILVLFTTNWSF